MHRLARLFSTLLVAAIGLLAAGTPASEQTGFPTPEDAVTAYIEGVARRDIKAVYAATAITEMSDGFDFVGQVGWLGALTTNILAPASDPFLVAINRATLTARIAHQLQFLAYGLLTTSELVTGKLVIIDEAGAAAFAAEVDAGRLGGIELVKIGAPNPTLQNSERNRVNQMRNATLHGAVDATDRIALIAFEGSHYVVGFMLMRYGEEWKVASQHSALAGGSQMGAPTPTTPEAFEVMLQ